VPGQKPVTSPHRPPSLAAPRCPAAPHPRATPRGTQPWGRWVDGWVEGSRSGLGGMWFHRSFHTLPVTRTGASFGKRCRILTPRFYPLTIVVREGPIMDPRRRRCCGTYRGGRCPGPTGRRPPPGMPSAAPSAASSPPATPPLRRPSPTASSYTGSAGNPLPSISMRLFVLDGSGEPAELVHLVGAFPATGV